MKKISLLILILTLLFGNIYGRSDIEKTGDVLQIAIPVGGLFYSLYSKDYEGSLDFTKAFSSTMIATYILKYSVNRTRPNGGDHSFPSGHTASAMSGASFIGRRYQNKFWTISSYLAASFVGYSRIYAKKHYFTDVLASTVIAGGFTYYFVETKRDFLLVPQIEKGLVSLYFKIDF